MFLTVTDFQAETVHKRGIQFSFSLDEKRLATTAWKQFTREHIIIDAPDELTVDLEHEDQDRWLLAGVSCRPGEWPVGRRGASGLPWANNPFILKWWTPSHDAVLQEAILRERWRWSVSIPDLLAITEPQALEEFKNADPKCKTWTWTTVLGYFARARADEEGFTARVRMESKWVRCRLCDRHCHQSRAYSETFIAFCTPCVKAHVFSAPCELGCRQIIAYLRSLTNILQRIPARDFGKHLVHFTCLSPEQLRQLLLLLKSRPSLKCVRTKFGDWFRALFKADVLYGARRTERGTRCIAADGHLCHSLGERTLCDLFKHWGVAHEREVRYPGDRGFRADWAIGEHLIEYLGLAGDPEYDARTAEKTTVASAFGKTLISIYPKDLIDLSSLVKKLSAVLPASAQRLEVP